MTSQKPWLAAVGWAIAGVVVSIPIIISGRFSFFGWPLLILSLMLGAVAMWRAGKKVLNISAS
jgi:hypothetical protein